MSIAIITQPQQPQPAANKSIYVVSGSNQAQTNFRYVADVRNSANALLARLKCDKLPNGNGFFNVASVIQTLIVPAKPNPVAGWQDAKVAEPYVLNFRDEFGTPPVVSTGSTNASGIVWKAYFPQQAIPVTSGFIGNIGKALTNKADNYTLRTIDHDFIACMKNVSDNFRVQINYVSETFVVLRSYNVDGANVSGAISAMFNAGPAGIRALTSGQTSDNLPGIVNFRKTAQESFEYYRQRATADGAVSELNPCALAKFVSIVPPVLFGARYQLFFSTSSTSKNVTFAKTITIDDCERYPSQIVYFRNALGGVDSYTFKMKNRKRLEAERSTFNRNSDVFGTTSFDKIWQTQYTEQLELNSDWLTDAEFRWLSEMFLTSEMWVLQNGSLVEAVVNSNSYNVSTRAVDRLQQLNIAIDIAFKNTTL
jgi:hypothetical protein